MPFVRFSRDKRGYEQVYLVADTRRGKNPRILYWYRTPPGVKVGREPFDEDVRRQLEAQNPDVTFDWKAIRSAQPPPDVEHWRERRRAEKAAKLARRSEEAADGATDGADVEPEAPPPIRERPGRQEERGSEAPAPEAARLQTAGPDAPMASNGTIAVPGDTARKRRRRRRRRRGPGDASIITASGASATDTPGGGSPALETGSETAESSIPEDEPFDADLDASDDPAGPDPDSSED